MYVILEILMKIYFKFANMFFLGFIKISRKLDIKGCYVLSSGVR